MYNDRLAKSPESGVSLSDCFNGWRKLGHTLSQRRTYAKAQNKWRHEKVLELHDWKVRKKVAEIDPLKMWFAKSLIEC